MLILQVTWNGLSLFYPFHWSLSDIKGEKIDIVIWPVLSVVRWLLLINNKKKQFDHKSVNIVKPSLYIVHLYTFIVIICLINEKGNIGLSKQVRWKGWGLIYAPVSSFCLTISVFLPGRITFLLTEFSFCCSYHSFADLAV